MEIVLTPEQQKKFLEDEWINIKCDGYRIFIELDHLTKSFYYGEVIKTKNGKTMEGYCFDRKDLEKMKSKRLHDPSYYSNDPLCPNCMTYMIYKFEYCPRCGQKLDWSEK